jgi:hypothetical protein
MQVEWLDLSVEEQKGNLRWVKESEPVIVSANEAGGLPGGVRPVPRGNPDAAHGAGENPAGNNATPPTPQGHDAVGWGVTVYWEGDKQHFAAVIKEYNPNDGEKCFCLFSGVPTASATSTAATLILVIVLPVPFCCS